MTIGEAIIVVLQMARDSAGTSGATKRQARAINELEKLLDKTGHGAYLDSLMGITKDATTRRTKAR